MTEMRELYQEVILDHNQQPRNFGTLDDANRTAEGYNPLCGDSIKLQLRVEDGIVREAAFEGHGCAIVTASASLMTEALKGKTVEEAEALFEHMMQLLTGDPSQEAEVAPELGKLAVFSGVREYPLRVKCATLAWHTMHAALQEQAEAVRTEADDSRDSDASGE
jgi:nitrogen fixation NifU-like protein